MRLKEYQVQALNTLSGYLDVLAVEHEAIAAALNYIEVNRVPEQIRATMLDAVGDPVLKAWKVASEKGIAASPDEWHGLKDGTGRSIPHVCLITT